MIPIEVTLVGIVTDVSPVHVEKACEPNGWYDDNDDKVNGDVNDLSNDVSYWMMIVMMMVMVMMIPIAVTLVGIVIDVSPEQKKKVESPRVIKR